MVKIKRAPTFAFFGILLALCQRFAADAERCLWASGELGKFFGSSSGGGPATFGRGLGVKKRYRSMRVRLVWVDIGEETLILVTNQSEDQLSAELVAELYRRRWQVELFFRWIRCILRPPDP